MSNKMVVRVLLCASADFRIPVDLVFGNSVCPPFHGIPDTLYHPNYLPTNSRQLVRARDSANSDRIRVATV